MRFIVQNVFSFRIRWKSANEPCLFRLFSIQKFWTHCVAVYHSSLFPSPHFWFRHSRSRVYNNITWPGRYNLQAKHFWARSFRLLHGQHMNHGIYSVTNTFRKVSSYSSTSSSFRKLQSVPNLYSAIFWLHHAAHQRGKTWWSATPCIFHFSGHSLPDLQGLDLSKASHIFVWPAQCNARRAITMQRKCSKL